MLQAENLIDQVGVQAHAFSTRGSATAIEANLNNLATTGLPIYVTELDIDGLQDAVQLDDYQRLFPVFWEHPAVQGITLWGYRPGMWRTDQGAFLIEEDGVTERPALEWLRSYVESTFLGTYELSASDHITVFPNPITSREVTIEGLTNIERLELFDISGRKIWESSPSSNLISIDTKIQSGMYFMFFYSENNVYAKKIVIQ